MKSVTFIIGLLMLAINIFAGKILSAYAPFNMWANCGVITVNVIFLWLVDVVYMKDGFRVSLDSLFPFLGIIEFLCIAFSRSQLEDNGAVIFVLLLILLQIVLLLVANQASRSTQQT